MGVTTSIQTRRGFTFVEVLLTSALLAPLVIGMCMMLDSMHKAYRTGERSADLQQSTRIVMGRIVRELRAAGLDPSVLMPRLPTQAAIQVAEDDRIAFIGDPSGDGSTKKIEYRLDSSTDPPVLRRQQWSTWSGVWSGTNGAQPLAEGITSAKFTYYGPDGNAIHPGELPARVGEIRRVRIVLVAAAPSDEIAREAYRLVSEVRVRNAGS